MDEEERTWMTPAGPLTKGQVTRALATLTDQQKRVAHLLAFGLTQREVGEILGITQQSVSRHKKAIRRKLARTRGV